MKSTINDILKNYPSDKTENLIPILQDIQESEGYLSEAAVVEVGKHLKLATGKIFGVATFYNQFRFKPLGKYHIQVCRGTACHVLGSLTVLEDIEKKLGIKAGNTTKDGMFSIEVVACIGACGLAPVVAINGNFYAKLNAKKINDIIDNYRNNE